MGSPYGGYGWRYISTSLRGAIIRFTHTHPTLVLRARLAARVGLCWTVSLTCSAVTRNRARVCRPPFQRAWVVFVYTSLCTAIIYFTNPILMLRARIVTLIHLCWATSLTCSGVTRSRARDGPSFQRVWAALVSTSLGGTILQFTNPSLVLRARIATRVGLCWPTSLTCSGVTRSRARVGPSFQRACVVVVSISLCGAIIHFTHPALVLRARVVTRFDLC